MRDIAPDDKFMGVWKKRDDINNTIHTAKSKKHVHSKMYIHLIFFVRSI